MYGKILQAIENLYKEKSFSVLKTPINSSNYLAFDFNDFQSLIILLKDAGIQIQYVELYDKNTFNYTPPDFWFNGTELNDCYIELQKFLEKLIDFNNQFYALEIKTNNSQSLNLKTSLNEIAFNKPSLNSKG